MVFRASVTARQKQQVSGSSHTVDSPFSQQAFWVDIHYFHFWRTGASSKSWREIDFDCFIALLILTGVRSVVESYRRRAENNFLCHSAASARGYDQCVQSNRTSLAGRSVAAFIRKMNADLSKGDPKVIRAQSVVPHRACPPFRTHWRDFSALERPAILGVVAQLHGLVGQTRLVRFNTNG
jgi:hypothetical protein